MPGRLEPEPVARRDFLGLAGMASAFAAVVGAVIGMGRLPKPRVLPEASGRIRVGKPDEFPAGAIKTLAEHNVRVIATDEGVAAMSLICTHLGCIVGETEEGFSCPCHGSVFDAEGRVTGGPAPRALLWLSVSQAADGSLVVDKNQEVEAKQFYRIA